MNRNPYGALKAIDINTAQQMIHLLTNCYEARTGVKFASKDHINLVLFDYFLKGLDFDILPALP